jgi:uncharacterized membrane-anchored protein
MLAMNRSNNTLRWISLNIACFILLVALFEGATALWDHLHGPGIELLFLTRFLSGVTVFSLYGYLFRQEQDIRQWIKCIVSIVVMVFLLWRVDDWIYHIQYPLEEVDMWDALEFLVFYLPLIIVSVVYFLITSLWFWDRDNHGGRYAAAEGKE